MNGRGVALTTYFMLYQLRRFQAFDSDLCDSMHFALVCISHTYLLIGAFHPGFHHRSHPKWDLVELEQMYLLYTLPRFTPSSLRQTPTFSTQPSLQRK
jgi:hypothetical protein